MEIDRNKPFADGVPFDDLWGMHVATRNELVYARMAYLTEFKHLGGTYGGVILARDWKHAEQRADERGLGERVIGTLEAIIPHDSPAPNT